MGNYRGRPAGSMFLGGLRPAGRPAADRERRPAMRPACRPPKGPAPSGSGLAGTTCDTPPPASQGYAGPCGRPLPPRGQPVPAGAAAMAVPAPQGLAYPAMPAAFGLCLSPACPVPSRTPWTCAADRTRGRAPVECGPAAPHQLSRRRRMPPRGGLVLYAPGPAVARPCRPCVWGAPPPPDPLLGQPLWCGLLRAPLPPDCLARNPRGSPAAVPGGGAPPFGMMLPPRAFLARPPCRDRAAAWGAPGIPPRRPLRTSRMAPPRPLHPPHGGRPLTAGPRYQHPRPCRLPDPACLNAHFLRCSH